MHLKCRVRRKNGKEHRTWAIVESRRVGGSVVHKYVLYCPVYHQKPDRIEAHLLVAFLAYCLAVTLRQQLRGVAGGLMPRVVFEKLATVQMLDVHIPTTDNREQLLVRRTEPDADVTLILRQLGLFLPPQPPPRIRSIPPYASAV